MMNNGKENLNLLYFIMGIFLVTVGISLTFFRSYYMLWLNNLLAIMFLLVGIFQLIVFFLRLDHPIKSIKANIRTLSGLLTPLTYFLIGLLLHFNDTLTTRLLISTIGLIFIALSVVHFISFYLLQKNRIAGRYKELFVSCLHALFSFVVLFSSQNISVTLVSLGIYLVVLGVTYIIYANELIFNREEKEKLKPRIRISLPIFVTAIIPYQTVQFLNRKFKEIFHLVDQNISFDSEESSLNSETVGILIHTGKTGFDRIGHVDIVYQDVVYSYGNHDIESYILFGAIGDGVLVEAPVKKYIDFVLSKNATVFSYTVQLTNEMKEALENQIKKLEEYTVPFEVTTPRQEESYIGELVRSTQANLYKFDRGLFKTYFVLGTNCVILSEFLLGTKGLDLVRTTGVLSPGTYYDYFDKQYYLKNTLVTDKKIYSRVLSDN